jgi:hypothetical protein
MYKTNSRFLQHTTRQAALRPRKVAKSVTPVAGAMIKGPKGKKKKSKEALTDQTLADAVKVSAERIRKTWAKQRSRGGKLTGKVLPSLVQD